MGSCVSVHKDHLESGMKLGSKNDRLVIPSPIKEKQQPIAANGDHRSAAEAGLKPQSLTTFRDPGSKEETFFDSQPWLESDCEDDFYSVNGDFTPSRGNTPVHHSFSVGTPQINRPVFMEKAPAAIPEPSPKKKLVELFKESLREVRDTDDKNEAGNQNDQSVKMEAQETSINLHPKSANGTSYVSGAGFVYNSERTSNGGIKTKETSIKSGHCCLPRLRSNHSFSEKKKKKKTSPVRSIG